MKQDWHKCIVRKAEQIFDEISQSEMIDEVNVKRVAQARNKFRGSIWGKKVREEIDNAGIAHEKMFERRDIPLSRTRWQFDVRKEYYASFSQSGGK